MNNLLPYWLSRYPGHPLAAMPLGQAPPRRCAGLAEEGDELALKVFAQQAMASGRLFTIAANFTDPHAYFVGGGVVETEPRRSGIGSSTRWSRRTDTAGRAARGVAEVA